MRIIDKMIAIIVGTTGGKSPVEYDIFAEGFSISTERIELIRRVKGQPSIINIQLREHVMQVFLIKSPY